MRGWICLAWNLDLSGGSSGLPLRYVSLIHIYHSTYTGHHLSTFHKTYQLTKHALWPHPLISISFTAGVYYCKCMQSIMTEAAAVQNAGQSTSSTIMYIAHQTNIPCDLVCANTNYCSLCLPFLVPVPFHFYCKIFCAFYSLSFLPCYKEHCTTIWLQRRPLSISICSTQKKN